MPRRRRETCVVCGRHTSVCGALSSRWKCGQCATRRLVESIVDVRRKQGDGYERWVAGMVKYAQKIGQGGV